MSNVKIKLAENGAAVRVYTSNPEFGYMVLESSEIVANGEWIRETKRTHIMKGSTDLLQKYAAATKGNLPGKITVFECVESQIPENYAKRLRSDIAYEEAVDQFIKSNGEGGILMCGEERILRFTNYDASGKQEDILVAHTHITANNAVANSSDADDAAFPAE